MANLLKIEIKKVFHNKFFWFALIVMTLLLVIDAVFSVDNYCSFFKINDSKYLETNSLYTRWIGGKANSFIPTLFYFLLPIFAVLPYSWSYYSERKSGYIRSVVTRVGKTKYFLTKFITVFLSGVIVIIVPLLVNYILIACFIPAYSKFNILEISLSLKNEDNTNGGLFIKQFNVFPKKLNDCMYYDTELAYLSEPKLQDGVRIRPNTEYNIVLPYQLCDGRLNPVKTEDTYYLLISNYPTKKLIKIET